VDVFGLSVSPGLDGPLRVGGHYVSIGVDSGTYCPILVRFNKPNRLILFAANMSRS
jgi:hypothetical protein